MGQVPETVVVDVTESPIERPVRKQKQFYSGKKKQHTFKSQLVVNLSTRMIVCTADGKGRRHDFRLKQAQVQCDSISKPRGLGTKATREYTSSISKVKHRKRNR